MFNVGSSELIILAVIALPGLALTAAPIVFAVLLWKRQTELRARVERLESSVSRHGIG
jgi:hypothetical protein